ncbi:HMCN [Mytilus edulis]|uniref:HMCN n=1 Tax=Mytilus edulis TaxID=6550 RepID=A0A8S3VQB6_MYTED|nr:HMCN [Mytilus edulis]
MILKVFSTSDNIIEIKKRNIADIFRSKRSSQNCIPCYDDIVKDAVCPWIPRINTDDFRQPYVIPEMVCASTVPRFGFQRGFKCQEITINMDVKRQSFITGNFTATKERIRVGCTPVMDCSTRTTAGYTVITGPTFKVEGDSVSLTCNSTYGTPVDWFLNKQLLDDSWTTANGVTTNIYTFLADKTHHLAMFECRVDNVLSATWYFQVYTNPNPPSLTGPSIVIIGTTYYWTCISTGGIPSPSMTMWIGDSQFNYNISSINTDITSTLQTSDKTYTVNFTLTWAPSIIHNGQTLDCHVQHPETSGNSRQTDSLLLTVNAEPNHPTLTGSQILIFGTTYHWTCISTGGIPSPIMTIWVGDSQINTGITQSSIKQLDGTYTVTATLSLAPSIIDNGQTLLCHVQHPATRVNKTVSLQLTVNEPLSVNATPTQYQQNIGITINLNCVVTGTATSITWYLNNQVINIASSSKYSNGNVINPSLTVSNIALSDAGLYICQATNGVETVNSNAITLTVLDFLTVTIPQSSYSVLIGQQVTIPCTVTGTPSQTSVFWRKVVNGVQTNVDINGSSRYTGSSTSSPSLTIINTQSSDEGTYVCYATNSVGTSNSQNTFLDVTGGVPIVTIGGSNFQVQVGNSITIGCTVTANPAVTSVYWTRDMNGQISNIGPSSNPSKYGGSTTVTPSLTIYNVDFSDRGNYQCFATNSVGTGSSQQISLDVQGDCRGTTSNIDVINSGGKYSGSTVPIPSLTINNAASSDEASYTCYATNSVGTGQSTSTSLNVIGNIPTVTVYQTIYNVNYGNSAVLVCSVTANPVHTSVYWRKIKNGVSTDIAIASSNSKYSGSTISNPSLQINNADLNDEANYVCFASNIVGTGQSSQTFLDVIGDIPTVSVGQNQYSGSFGQTVTMVCTVQANPSETSVYWRKLVNGQMTSIDMNNVRYTGSTVGSPSLTITALELSDEGYYQCYAQNSVGTGQSQQAFLDVIGDIPIVEVLSNTYSVNFGGTIVLGCQVTANPLATDVYWQKLVNGVLITVDMSTNNFNKYSGSTVQSPSLVIIDATEADERNYVCSATNAAGTGSSSQTFLNVVGNIPTVSIPLNAYSVDVGSQITIPCTVSANPSETNIYWTVTVGNNAEQTVAMTNTQKYQGSSINSPSLIILSTTQSDSGVYRCHATNNVGTGQSNPTTLNIVGTLPIVTVAQTNYPVNYGQSIQLVCTVSATPSHTQVYWTRVQNTQAVTITTSNTAKYSGSTVSNPSLTINVVDQNDETFYVCYATNAVGTGQSQRTFVDVSGSLPVVTVQSNSYSVLLGQTASLVCTISANPSATSVLWYKVINGVQSSLSTTAGKYNTPTVNSPNLIINTAAQSDDGYYVCTATNIVGTGSSSQTYLTVTGNLPSVTIALSNYNINIGATVTLGCTVVASPSATNVYWQRIVTNLQQNIPVVTVQENVYSVNIGSSINLVCNVQANPSHTSVTWRKIINGVTTTVTISGRFSGATVNSPTLTITNAILDDEGYYICFAMNIVGTGQSSQTFLDVIGSIPTVTIGSNYYSVNYGNTATIVCNVVATPTETSISWQKILNGIPSTVVISGRYQGGTVSSPNLIITGAESTDEAFYICSASNSLGTGQSSQTYLDVQGCKYQKLFLVYGYCPTITQFRLVFLSRSQCTVTANPSHTSVTWKKIVNGQETNIGSNSRFSGGSTNTPSLTISNTIDTDEGYYICAAANAVGTGQSSQTYLDITGRTPSLTILNADINDVGSYTCYATNSVGTGQSQQTQLSVVGNVPSVTVGQGYTVVLGNSITLTCTILATPSATSVQWNRITNNAPIAINVASNPTKYAGASVSTPSLTISNSVEGDEGYYTCQATNSVGTGTSIQTFLNVQGTIPVVTIPQSQYSVTVGSSVTMVCTVSANPAHTSVNWQKVVNGVSTNINLSQTNKYSGSTTSSPSLTIINAVIADQGYYTCSAQNSVGTGTSSQTYLGVSGSM